MAKNKGTSQVKVQVKAGLDKKAGQKAAWNAAKRAGKTDARGISYNPKTGKATVC